MAARPLESVIAYREASARHAGRWLLQTYAFSRSNLSMNWTSASTPALGMAL